MVKYKIENRAPTETEIDEIIALMNKVWLKIYYNDGFYKFDRHFFDWYAKSPLQKPEYFWIVVEETTRKIIGFALAMPRMMMIHGTGPQLFGYGSLITVDLDYQKQGIAKAIGENAKQLAERIRINGSIAIVEAESKGLQTLNKEMKANVIPLWTHEYTYIRPLNMRDTGKYLNMKWYEQIGAKLIQGVKPISDSRIRSSNPSDHPQILTLLNEYAHKLDFARVWNLEELQFYLSNPIIHSKVLEEGGKIKAVAHAVEVQFSVKDHLCKLAIMENMNYENIPFVDQKRLIQALIYDLKTAGVTIATDFAIGYNSPKPIAANRFIKYPRKMTFYFMPIYNPNDEIVMQVKKYAKITYIDIR